MNKKLFVIISIVIAAMVLLSGAKSAEIPKPKGGKRRADLNIRDWNPPTSLATHFGKGSNSNNSPIFNFNLNLGYARFFMKSDVVEDDTYLYNSNFSYIIEFRPLDFASFLSSGSEYAIYMEKTEYLRNLTLIMSNKTYSSTQFLTSKILWYFDFIYNSMNIGNIIIPQNKTSQSALENLYPSNREESFGLSDRFHVLQTPDMALGLVFYLESLIPSGKKQVAKGPLAGTLDNLYSSRFTYSTLGGVFFRMKESSSFELSADLMYQRLYGDYDGWVITVQEQTVSLSSEVILYERYYVHLNYYLINWISDEYDETVYSHSVNLGGEIKGFGTQLEWLGFGAEFFFQDFSQTRGYTYLSNLGSLGLAFSTSWFPLSFHEKNHQLEISLIYGLFEYEWDKQYYSGAISESGAGWAYSFMVRIDYSF